MNTPASPAAGQVVVGMLVFSAIGIVFLTGAVGWATMNIRIGTFTTQRERAFHIAEAGQEYYRWHLAHAPTDFQDGTGAAGPYAHDFRNKDGATIGQFILTITAPPVGSTLVQIASKGTVTANQAVGRQLQVLLAKPSWAKFAILANDDMRFGEGTEVFGPIHTNEGMRFDGVAHNVVTSARTSYNDPDHSGGNEFGVHTHVSPTDPGPPSSVPSRPDVFEAGRQFPVPAIDFDGVTSDLAQIKTDAQAAGQYYAASGSLGYHIVLRTDDTYDAYRVTSVMSPPNGCVEVIGQQDWGTWTISAQTFLHNRAIPANGLIFVEDHVWVNGQINSARVTIAAARFPANPANRRHITINNDLLYTTYDGSDVISLIAQGNINVGLVSEDNLRIDGALVAQNGRVGRHYYRPPSGNQNRCSPNHVRQTITLYGMIATNERYGFAYTDGTGYQNRIITYDSRLLYAPPPSFPLTSDQYSTVSWKEVIP